MTVGGISDSGMDVKVNVVTGELDSAEAVPGWQADMLHAAGMVGAEMVAYRYIDTHIAGVAALLCDSLGLQNGRQLTEVYDEMVGSSDLYSKKKSVSLLQLKVSFTQLHETE